MADDPQAGPGSSTVSDSPRGTIIVGPISTAATAAPNIVLPKFILDRDIFRGNATPPSQTANFVPKLGKNQKVEDLQLQTVQLFNFTFCGKKFNPANYSSFTNFGKGTLVKKIEVRGVGKTLAVKLIAAQEEIFRAFALERLGNNQPIDDEKAFDRWCALHESNGGYGFRNGPHFGGSAIDMNVTGCPYVATGRLDPATGQPDVTLGGEVRGDQPRPEQDAMRVAFTAALLAYDRAFKFINGDSATFDLSQQKGSESASQLYTRFSLVSTALSQYFSFAYDKRAPLPKLLEAGEVHQLVDIDTFVQRVSAEFDLDPTDPNGFAQIHPSFQQGMAGDRKAFLTPILEQVRQDHETLRQVMVQGSMKFLPDAANPGGLVCDVSKSRTRDPCFGFLDLRLEIVEALLAQGLRWGAGGFSNPPPTAPSTLLANGDMMHFDLGFNKRPDLVPDPNPDQLGYK